MCPDVYFLNIGPYINSVQYLKASLATLNLVYIPSPGFTTASFADVYTT